MYRVLTALFLSLKRPRREADCMPPSTKKFTECHNSPLHRGNSTFFTFFYWRKIHRTYPATLHFVELLMLSVKLPNRWSLFAPRSHWSNKERKQKIFRGFQSVRLSGGLKKVQVMLSKGWLIFYWYWPRSLQLTLAVAWAGESRPLLVCDQKLKYSSWKYSKLKCSCVLCVWVNAVIFYCELWG